MRRFLVLDGGSSLYGIGADHVREITPERPTTRIPGAPPHVRGLLNLRGTLVPLLDLAERLTGQGVTSADPSIVVVHADGRLLALLVDDVLEVEEVDEAAVAPSPAGGNDSLVTELGHLDDRIVLLVDVPELVRQTLA